VRNVTEIVKIVDKKTGKTYTNDGKPNYPVDQLLHDLTLESKLDLVWCDLETLAIGLDGEVYILDETGQHDWLNKDRFDVSFNENEVAKIVARARNKSE
jgi:hypothetical protein